MSNALIRRFSFGVSKCKTQTTEVLRSGDSRDGMNAVSMRQIADTIMETMKQALAKHEGE